jgi:hypothetical protein
MICSTNGFIPLGFLGLKLGSESLPFGGSGATVVGEGDPNQENSEDIE